MILHCGFIYLREAAMSRKKLFKLHPIKRSSRKVGRNEPCPCGKTKDVLVPDSDGSLTLNGGGEVINVINTKVRVKYKHCHGNEQFQNKSRLIKQAMEKFFYNMTHNKPKKAKLAVIVDKLKEAFNMKHFGRKF
jgi:hypothetical protein